MVTKKEKIMAGRCLTCPLCRYARKKQKGLFFWLVKKIQHICPFCKAYEKAHGRKAHELIPQELKS